MLRGQTARGGTFARVTKRATGSADRVSSAAHGICRECGKRTTLNKLTRKCDRCS